MKRILLTIACVLLLVGCRTSYEVVSVQGERLPMNAAYDDGQDEVAASILLPYKQKVDEVMNEPIGRCARKLESYRPESPLSNLIADIIRLSAEEKTGISVDMGLMNMGGIRNILNEGVITVGDIFQICPFENALAVVTLSGAEMQQLMEQIAALGGEGVSGVELVIKDGKPASVKVGGRPIDPNGEYHVATIDYLAEGNDKLDVFKTTDRKIFPENGILRDVFIEYVKRLESQGKAVDAKAEKRITSE